jgi:hypothetical protein
MASVPGNDMMQLQPSLIGFEKADSANALLAQIGLGPDLGSILANHLSLVLRQQYSDLQIESIEFVSVGSCGAGGMPTANPETIGITTLSLPVHTEIVVVASKERYKLSLEVIINGTLEGDKYNVKSDVIVKAQMFLGLV